MIGFQIRKRERKVDAATVAKFRELPVANISDSMSRMTAGGAALRPMHRGGALAGPAFTVKTRPGDNLMVHKALDIAEPGDVIVVDGGGNLTNSLIGEMMVAHAALRTSALVERGGAGTSATFRSSRPASPIAGLTRTAQVNSTWRLQSKGW